MNDYQKIIDNYISWIRDNTDIKAIGKDGEICEITTPFFDRHNDHLQIYVLKKGNHFVLTDDGYAIEDLKMSGMEISSPKREKIFRTILNGFGVKLGDKGDLYIEATSNNIGQKKHYLLQAILAVNDMYSLSLENVYSLFKEDVERYFKINSIFYSKDIKISGKTGFDHNIDFLISASNSRPERLIKTINNPGKDPVMAAIFAFNDIAEMREQKSTNYVLYNDTEKTVGTELVDALKNYGIQSVPWSKKDLYKKEFALS